MGDENIVTHFFIGTILVLITLILLDYLGAKKSEVTDIPDTIDIVVEIDIPFTDSVKQFIEFMNLDYPDIVYAQAVLESGHFKSDLFINNGNMFGMKEAMVRNSVALGTKNGYAYYKNWQHSIIDYALYQATYYHTSTRKLTRQEYLEKLARTYAKDPDYIKKLNNIIRSNLY